MYASRACDVTCVHVMDRQKGKGSLSTSFFVLPFIRNNTGHHVLLLEKSDGSRCLPSWREKLGEGSSPLCTVRNSLRNLGYASSEWYVPRML